MRKLCQVAILVFMLICTSICCAATLESEWWKTSSIKKFDPSAANMELFRQGKTEDDKFYIDKEVYFGKASFPDGIHDMAVAVLCSNVNCENDLERITWALELCDLTTGTQKMISHYFVLESNIFIADTNGVMPLLCDTYSEDGTVNAKEWEKMKQLDKTRINPNINCYRKLFNMVVPKDNIIGMLGYNTNKNI